MPAIADRVKDTTTSTGVGPVTLANSAPLGFRTFPVAFGSAPLVVGYCIQDAATGDWEVGKGTFNGTTGLTRDSVRSSSNGNALVNFAAGTKDVFCTASAELIDNSNAGMQYAMSRGFGLP